MMNREQKIGSYIGTALESVGRALDLAIRRGEFDEASRFLDDAMQQIKNARDACGGLEPETLDDGHRGSGDE